MQLWIEIWNSFILDVIMYKEMSEDSGPIQKCVGVGVKTHILKNKEAEARQLRGLWIVYYTRQIFRIVPADYHPYPFL